MTTLVATKILTRAGRRRWLLRSRGAARSAPRRGDGWYGQRWSQGEAEGQAGGARARDRSIGIDAGCQARGCEGGRDRGGGCAGARGSGWGDPVRLGREGG